MGYEKNHENGGNIQATTKTMTMKMTREEGKGEDGKKCISAVSAFSLPHTYQTDSQTVRHKHKVILAARERGRE